MTKEERQERYRNYIKPKRQTPEYRAYQKAYHSRPEVKERANSPAALSYRKEYSKKLKAAVRDHYGRKCSCCGETQDEFLTIDHINGGGGKHRREITGSKNHAGGALAFYRWLRDNNYPEGFRTLCYNCNCSIGHYGYCPHKRNTDYREVAE